MKICNTFSFSFSFFPTILSLSVILTAIFFDASADPWTHLQQGDKTAQDFLNQSSQKQKEAGKHPFYKGISNESKLSPEQLQTRAQNIAQKSEVKQMIVESMNERPQFTLDPLKDPLFTGAQKVLEKPLQSIGGEGVREVVTPAKTGDEILTCEEARTPYPQTCVSEIIVSIEKTKEKKAVEGNLRVWMHQGAINNGVYLACQAIRNHMFRLVRCNGDITAAYKACMQELAHKKRGGGGCVELPSVGIPVDKIIEVKITSTPTKKKGKNGRIKQQFDVSGGGDIYEDLANKKSYYTFNAHIKIIY